MRRGVHLFAFVPVMVAVATGSEACVGDDPTTTIVIREDSGSTDGAANLDGNGPSQGDGASNDGVATADVANESSGGDGGAFGLCPALTGQKGCGLQPGNVFSPNLRLDACSPGKSYANGSVVTSWVADNGPNATGFPVGSEAPGATSGAVFCAAGLNSRPAFMFRQHGFTIDTTQVLMPESEIFTLAVVMRDDAQSGDPDTLAGSIVFQRNEDTPTHFRGPQLAANFAFASAPETTGLMPTDFLGASLQFGTQNDLPPDGGAIASVTTEPIKQAAVVIARSDGAIVKLWVRTAATTYDLAPSAAAPAGFTVASGLPIHIGRAGSGNNFFKGAISELIYYTRALPENERTELENNLYAKWLQ